MTTFALVHGAWHGSWCWDRLAPELEARGHGVIAVDLPAESATAGMTAYRDVVLGALDAVGEDVVLVGHSLGGITVPLVGAARPVRRVVYLTPAIPEPGRSLVETLEAKPQNIANVLAELEVVDGAFVRYDPDRPELLYNGCDAADTDWAMSKLTLQALQPMVEPFPADGLPDAPSTVILGRDDRLIDVALASAIAEERLGVTPVVVPSGHSPFLSMPAALAELLVGLG